MNELDIEHRKSVDMAYKTWEIRAAIEGTNGEENLRLDKRSSDPGHQSARNV